MRPPPRGSGFPLCCVQKVKGYGMGAAVDSEYDAHQAKKLTAVAIEAFAPMSCSAVARAEIRIDKIDDPRGASSLVATVARL